jgi:AcrR family transcriptional regulator
MIGAVTDEQDKVVRRRGPRRDAADNRDRVLAAAAVAVRREGIAVPMATIAADAGVGVGTVYRHYPSREALLGALTHRSFQLVLETARRAAALDAAAIDRIRFFLEQTIEHGSALVLPMHGGPAPTDQATVAVREEAHRTLGSILERGQHDGTIRTEVTRADIVTFGALLAQGLPHVPDWKLAARRQADIYLAGILNCPDKPGAGR